jgi:GTP-binding protein
VYARSGLTPTDEIIAEKLRKLNKPIYLAVNKIDGLNADTVLSDFYRLGLGEPFLIAAEHGRGVELLMQKVLKRYVLPETAEITEEEKEANAKAAAEAEEEKGVIRFAIVGRPNVGKSTLVNRFLGEERVVVSDQPGTTRDSIFVNFTRHGKEYILIDTAGVRRRGKIYEVIEKISVIKTMQAIEAANVVVLLLDAQENITDQDLKLLGFVLDRGKALVIAINKWDNISTHQREWIERELERRLTFVNFAKIHFISALHGTGVGNLFRSIDRAYFSATKAIKTANINRILEDAVAAHQPPLVNGRSVKLLYAHVAGHNPPLIIIHGTRTSAVPQHYVKYLENYFIKTLRLTGTPIKIEFRDGGESKEGGKVKS